MFESLKRLYWRSYYFIFGEITEQYVREQFKKLEEENREMINPQLQVELCDCVVYDLAGSRKGCRPNYSKTLCNYWKDPKTKARCKPLGFCKENGIPDWN